MLLMSARKKIVWVAALIIIAAVIIVIYVSFFTEGQAQEFDGTLVRYNFDFPRLL